MLCPAGKLGSFYGRVAERLRQINHCRFDSCPVHERMFFYMVYSPAARRNVGRRFWDHKILKAMGATTNKVQTNVSVDFPIYWQSFSGKRIQKTLQVSVQVTSENGRAKMGEIKKAAWLEADGTMELEIPAHFLPIAMRSYILVEAMDLAETAYEIIQ